MTEVSLSASLKSRDLGIVFYRPVSYVHSRSEELLVYPTIDRSSDCLLSASVLIFCSTLLISDIGNLLNTSSGSTPAQSTSSLELLPTVLLSDFLRDKYRRRLVSGLDKPEETTDSAKVGIRSESVRVCRREEEGSKETSEENESVLGSWDEPARGVERVDIVETVTEVDERVRVVKQSRKSRDKGCCWMGVDDTVRKSNDATKDMNRNVEFQL